MLESSIASCCKATSVFTAGVSCEFQRCMQGIHALGLLEVGMARGVRARHEFEPGTVAFLQYVNLGSSVLEIFPSICICMRWQVVRT